MVVMKCTCSVPAFPAINCLSAFLLCFFSTVQPCTEVLFLDIFHNYSQTLTPVLLEMVQNLQGQLNVQKKKLYYMLKAQSAPFSADPLNTRKTCISVYYAHLAKKKYCSAE